MSYNFTWPHKAEEVYVTGTFDNWGKTVKLDKKDTVHEKWVSLPQTSDKILYKFVADGEWKHDHTGKTETDHEGNVNNVLYPQDIKPPHSAAHPVISSVAPGASTTAMAGDQPLERESLSQEKHVQDTTPGAFPETPAANDGQDFSVNPIPVTGPSNSQLTSTSIESGVHDDPELKAADEAKTKAAGEQTVGISPLPATGGIGNPIQLTPGAPVPDAKDITGNTLTSNVKLDKDSYEKSDAGAPVLPPVSTSTYGGREAAAQASILGGLGIGPATSNIIPESSLPMGKDANTSVVDPTISSVAPTSSTNQLAAQQPIQPHQPPSIVKESQQEAGADPEASASPSAVQEKNEVENELTSKVPEAPATTETSSGARDNKEKNGWIGVAAGGLAGVGAAAGAVAYAAREKSTQAMGKDPVSILPDSVQKSINSMNSQPPTTGKSATTAHTSSSPPAAFSDVSLPTQAAAGEGVKVPGGDGSRDVASDVPEEVAKSQKEAHVAPEAATSSEAVAEKSAVEQELLKKVPESEAHGEPAPTTSAATTSTAPTTTAQEASSGTGSSTDTPGAAIGAGGLAGGLIGAGAVAGSSAGKSATGAPQLSDPTSGVGALSMEDKPLAGSKELNAPADEPAVPQADKVNQLAAEAKQEQDSRDVSPMTKTNDVANINATKTSEQTQPVVTTGVDSAKAPTESTPTSSGQPVGTPRKPQNSENTTPGKRGSFIDRLRSPDSARKTNASDNASPDAGGKRKSFFSKIKEKLKQ
ncbi:hypothetical protein EJ03DRAFT_106523 [Teratosphaeria nubilosa]|uniref:AMP-activated protein kinase glycogen-binding domain-containing protein n=1 Tax=Teratosphaeria nubilosa TaxID=161662 RepID=A0A6G1L926_9PEZI|nr:hypothetical protein EJ03DRAFT_106523 [Teratosphaeria nubilosa]